MDLNNNIKNLIKNRRLGGRSNPGGSAVNKDISESRTPAIVHGTNSCIMHNIFVLIIPSARYLCTVIAQTDIIINYIICDINLIYHSRKSIPYRKSNSWPATFFFNFDPSHSTPLYTRKVSNFGITVPEL